MGEWGVDGVQLGSTLLARGFDGAGAHYRMSGDEKTAGREGKPTTGWKEVYYWYLWGFAIVSVCLIVPYETYEAMWNWVGGAVIIWFMVRVGRGVLAKIRGDITPKQPRKTLGDYALITLLVLAIAAIVVGLMFL